MTDDERRARCLTMRTRFDPWDVLMAYRAGLSQAAVAHRIGCGETTVRRILMALDEPVRVYTRTMTCKVYRCKLPVWRGGQAAKGSRLCKWHWYMRRNVIRRRWLEKHPIARQKIAALTRQWRRQSLDKRKEICYNAVTV